MINEPRFILSTIMAYVEGRLLTCLSEPVRKELSTIKTIHETFTKQAQSINANLNTSKSKATDPLEVASDGRTRKPKDDVRPAIS